MPKIIIFANKVIGQLRKSL